MGFQKVCSSQGYHFPEHRKVQNGTTCRHKKVRGFFSSKLGSRLEELPSGLHFGSSSLLFDIVSPKRSHPGLRSFGMSHHHEIDCSGVSCSVATSITSQLPPAIPLGGGCNPLSRSPHPPSERAQGPSGEQVAARGLWNPVGRGQ